MKKEEKIIELLDIGFLEKLKEIGKLYGWNGDYHEIREFIIYLYKIYGIEYNEDDFETYECDE